MKTADILGYKVSSESLGGDVRHALELLDTRISGQYVSCLNPHSFVVASKDSAFKEALNDSDILLPDGIGIVMASSMLGKSVNKRVAGSEFFIELTRQLNEKGGSRYFFLGSTEQVLDLITARLSKDFPNIEIAGSFSPPYKESFSQADNTEMVNRINSCNPDVLWVGMTAPKQEKWIHANRHDLEVPLIGAIGAVFDFYAGTRKRSPEFFCKIGLEWLPRLLREPKRLFKRNVISTPLFLWAIFKAKLKQTTGKRQK